MPFMPWSKKMETGIDAIDGQHLWLVEAINLLHDELAKPDPERIIVGCILEGMIDYISHHFATEAHELIKWDTPETRAHLTEHREFTMRMTEYEFQFQAGKEIGVEMLEYLKAWLTHHTLEVDQACAKYMQDAKVE